MAMAKEKNGPLKRIQERAANSDICHDNTNMEMVEIRLSSLTVSVIQIIGIHEESEGISNSEYAVL